MLLYVRKQIGIDVNVDVVVASPSMIITIVVCCLIIGGSFESSGIDCGID